MLISGTDTVDECNTFRFFTVRWFLYVTTSRTGCVDHSFNFHCGNYVSVSAVTVFVFFGWVIWVVTGCCNDGTNMEFDFFWFHVTVDCFRTTYGFTKTTVDTVVFVDSCTERYCLREWDVSCSYHTYTFVVVVRYFDRTDFLTLSTSSTVFFFNVSRFFLNFYSKVTDVTVYFFYFCVSN